MRCRAFVLAIGCLCIPPSSTAGQSGKTQTVTAIRASAMIDVESGAVVKSAVVVVEGDRIRAVGPNLSIPQGARLLDLGNSTLLPGLIDAHTHLLDNRSGANVDSRSAMLLSVAQASTAKRARWAQRWHVRCSMLASQPCGISGTPESAVTSPYATPSRLAG